MNGRDMANRVLMMIARGVLRGVNDDGKRQLLQVELLQGELRDGVERMQNYGFNSHPTGGDVAALSVAGNREQIIVLAVDDRRYHLVLQPGEVAMFDDLGNKVELLRDMVKITAVQHCEVEAPTTLLKSAVTIDGSLTVNGNVATTGTITNNGKNIGSTHTHPGDSGGTTGTPN